MAAAAATGSFTAAFGETGGDHVDSGSEEEEESGADSGSESEMSRHGPRIPPVGAAASDPETTGAGETVEQKLGKLKELEETQEDLNCSLLNLTSHFAQVQFRLKQIINAPPDLKQDLLAELEEFASKGCVDTRPMKRSKDSMTQLVTSSSSSGGKAAGATVGGGDCMTAEEHEKKLAQQRTKQQELIGELKEQLQELETFAYESGVGELPQSVLVEKQRAMIDQLRNRLNIDLQDFDHLSNEELKKIVDSSIQRIINPAKAKEDLLFQLQSQISDLERFIDYLMEEGGGGSNPVGNQAICSCAKRCPLHSDSSEPGKHDHGKHLHGHSAAGSRSSSSQRRENYNSVRKAMYLVQMYLLANLGCVGGVGGLRHPAGAGAGKFTMKDRDDDGFGHKLDKLNRTVATILQLNSGEQPPNSDYHSDSSDTPPVKVNVTLLRTIRRNLVNNIRDLLEFGMTSGDASRSSLVPAFSCFSTRAAHLKAQESRGGGGSSSGGGHVWQLFLQYYHIKHGSDYVHTPVRKLSDAFKLDMVGGKAVTAKQTLLSAIDAIVDTHAPLKRNFDSQFKALVCRGLNERRLSLWFRLVLRTQEIVEKHYSSWSYVVKLGFDDVTKALDKLTHHSFTLPVNMAVQPIRGIKDAF